MGNLMPIGVFSNASLLSIKALRNYHELGLLRPAAVDPRTGYRAYSSAQLADAETIRRLRELDLPLDDIRRVLEARDPDTTRGVLDAHRRRMAERLEQAARALDALKPLLDDPAALYRAPVRERDQRAAPVALVRGRATLFDIPSFLSDAFGRLSRHIKREGAAVAGPFGAQFGDGGGWPDGEVDVVAFAPLGSALRAEAGGVEPGALPEARLAVATHGGPYEGLGEAYRSLGAWVAGRGLSVAGPLQEHYLIGPHHAPNPADYRTEVGWPVRS